MSHFLTLAFIEPEVAQRGVQDVLEKVNRIMGVYTANLLHADDAIVRWDGWMIGGRYDGVVNQDQGARDAQVEKQALWRNMRVVHDLPEGVVPFAVVTSDGRCRMEGKMGPFGYSYDHDPYWEDTYDALCEQYADCIAVGLDCHI